MEIKRDFYLQKLLSRRHNGMIKVITGMRRCGKSYGFQRMIIVGGLQPTYRNEDGIWIANIFDFLQDKIRW